MEIWRREEELTMEEADPFTVRRAGSSSGSRWSGVMWWVGLKYGRVLYSWAVQFHTLECQLSFAALPFLSMDNEHIK